MRKAIPYISAFIYIVLLTIISFNATAAAINWNTNNSESGLNKLNVNGIDYVITLKVDTVINWLKQGVRSKIHTFNANLNSRSTHNTRIFNLSNYLSATPLPSSLWLTAISLLGGLVTRRVETLSTTSTGKTQTNYEVQQC